MTCDHCVRKVAKALQDAAGVKSVQVDRASAKATITFDRAQTDIPQWHDTLLKSGYQPSPVAG